MQNVPIKQMRVHILLMSRIDHSPSVGQAIARAHRKRRPCRRVLLFTPFLIRLLVRVLFERYAQRLDE
jgi:hypothetical protein